VGEDFLGQVEARGHQKRRPEHRVEAKNLFTNQVQVGRPEAFTLDGCLVCDESLEPDVEHVRRFAFDGYTPLDICARNRQIRKTLPHEGQCFVAPRLRLDEIGRLVKLQESFCKRGKLEEEVLLRDSFGGPAAIRAGVARLGVVNVQIVEDAILPGVRTLVDITILPAPIEEIIHHAGVFRVRGPLEVVDFEVQHLPLPSELGRYDVAEFQGSLALSLRGAFDVDAMLVATGGEHGLVTLHALKAFDEVGNDSRIGMADMRRGVDVIDRRGQVVFVHLEFFR
jgi:hypothetical protein